MTEQCHAYLDLDWLLYGDEEVDPSERFTDLPLITCGLKEGHEGPHQAVVEEEDDA